MEPINVPGGTGTDDALRQSVALKSMYRAAYTSLHKEFGYDGGTGDIILIEVWDTVAKLVKRFTRTVSYNVAGDVSGRVTTDETSGSILTDTYAYFPNGDVQSATEVVT